MAVDNFGRDVGGVDVAKMFSSLSGKVAKILETRDSHVEVALGKVIVAVNDVADRLDSQAKAQAKSIEKFAEAVIDSHKEIFKKDQKAHDKEHKGDATEAKLTRIAVEKIVKMGENPNTFWVGVGHFNSKAIQQMKRILIDCGLCNGGSKMAAAAASAAATAVTKSGAPRKGQNPMSGGTVAGGIMGNPDGVSKMSGVINGLNTAVFALTTAAIKMSDMFEVNLTDSFKGVLINSNRFRENLRAIIFQTQTYGDTNRAVEKEFIQITQSVLASGVSRAKYEALWVDNLQRGFAYMGKIEKADKDRGKLLIEQIRNHQRVQTTALNTATNLGMNADAVNSVFMDWNMQLTMSANQLSDMGRSMRQISLATGVTGANLERALKSADATMRKMRSAGTLTDTAAKNVLEMTVNAQKFGVEEAFNPLMSAMGSTSGWNSADPSTQGFLQRSTLFGGGSLPDLISGRSMGNKDEMKKIMGGAQSQVGSILKNFGIDSTAPGFDFTKISEAMQGLDPLAARNLQMVIKQLTGMEVGDLERSFQVMEESTKTLGDRMSSLDKEIQESIKTKGAESDATKALMRQRTEMETTGLQTMFGKITDEMKKGKTLDQAQAAVKGQLTKDFGASFTEGIMKDMGGSAGKLLGGAKSRAEAAGMDLNKLLKNRGTSASGVEEALKSGSADERSKAFAALDESMQEISRREKEGQDPITNIAGGVKDINTKLGDIANRMFFSSDLLLKILFWTGKVGGFVGSIFSLMSGWNFFKSITGMFGGGAGVGGLMGGGGAAGGSGGAVASTLGSTFLKVLGPLILAVGALKGVIEADTAKRTKLEGGILGALTGGAGTGSVMSGMMGVEKGSNSDKALGVVGGAAWGAAAGAAIGAAFFGVGAGPGALIGAIVGSVVEIIKILTEGTDVLATILDPIQVVIDVVWGTLKDIWGILAGIVTLDLNRVITSAMNLVARLISAIPALLLSTLRAVFVGIPKLAFAAIKGVFFTLPKMLMDSIKAGFASLSKNEWVGPIFEVLGEAFNEIYDAWMTIYTPLKDAFDAVYSAFNELSETIFGKSGPMFEKVMGWVKWGIGGLAKALAFLMKPVVWLAKAIGFVVRGVGALASVLGTLIGGIVDVFKGIFTLDGTMLLGGLKTIFAQVPMMLFELLKKAFWDFPKYLYNTIVSGLGTFGDFVIDSLQSVFIDFPIWLYDNITTGMADLGTWMYDNTIGKVIDAIPDWVKNLAGGVAKGGSMLASAGGAVMDFINPLNWFEDGTREIGKTGVAMVHEGEMIVPKSVMDSLKAVGSGPFDAQSEDLLTGDASASDKGAFESGQGKEANSSGWIQKAAELMFGSMNPMGDGPGGIMNKLSGPMGMGKHLIDAFTKKSATDESGEKGVAGAGSGMYYEDIMNSVMGASPIGGIVEALKSSPVGKILGSVLGLPTGEASTNLLDYSDDTKGSVSPLAMSATAAEDRVAQEKYGSSPSSSVIPGMEGIEGYLAAENNMMKTMVELLESIRDNTSGKSKTQVVGPRSRGLPPTSGMGMRRVSLDQNAGQWDVTFGDFSPSSVTTEGRRT